MPGSVHRAREGRIGVGVDGVGGGSGSSYLLRTCPLLIHHICRSLDITGGSSEVASSIYLASL